MIRILHVDDEKDAQELTEFNLLRHSGNLQIEQAESGRTAIEMLSAREYDCVICDYMMPDMDGLQLLRVIREAGNDMPFVFLTCQGNEEIAAEAFRAGADDYYTKEVGFAHYDRMTHSIKRIVEAKAQREQRERADEKIRHLNLVLKAIRNVIQLISKEKERDRLIERVCDELVKTRGYFNAWVALFDESGGIEYTAESGLGGDFLLLSERLKRGELTLCARKALEQTEPVYIEDPLSTCSDCPLAKHYSGRGAMTVRLENGGKVYGLMSVSVHAGLTANEEERRVFQDVAGDIAFALHGIEIEEERRLAEKMLQVERDRAQQYLDVAGAAFVALDNNGCVTLINQRGLNILGYQESELIGRNWFDTCLPKRMRGQVYDVYKQLMAGETELVEYFENPILTKDGEERIIAWHNTILRNAEDDIVGSLSSGEDITEHSLAEEALRESEERYRSFVSQASEGIFRLELDKPMPTEIPVEEQIEHLYKYTYLAECNQAMVKMYGASKPDDLIGKRLSEFYGGADNPVNTEALREFIASNYLIVGVETQERDKDGNILYFSNNSTGIVEDNHLIRMWGTQADITERKRSDRVRESIYRISETANAAKNLQELFSSIHGIIGELMPAENFYIALFDRSSDMLSFPYFADQFDETPAPRKLGKGLTEYVLRTGRSLLATPDVFERLAEKGEVESIGAPSIDWLGVPLKTPEKTIGVLVVQTYTEGVRYGEEEEKILEFVSTQAAMAIERKQAEEELRKAFRLLEQERKMFVAGPAVVFRWKNQEGWPVEYVSPSVKAVLDYSTEEFESGQVPYSEIIPKEDIERFTDEVRTNSESGVDLFEHEPYRLIRKDGKTIWVADYTTILRDEAGRITHYLGYIIDITERK